MKTETSKLSETAVESSEVRNDPMDFLKSSEQHLTTAQKESGERIELAEIRHLRHLSNRASLSRKRNKNFFSRGKSKKLKKFAEISADFRAQNFPMRISNENLSNLRLAALRDSAVLIDL